MTAEQIPQDGPKPEWMTALVTALHEHPNPGDRHREVREWIGLAIAALLTYLLASGIGTIGALQAQADRTESVTVATKAALDRHIRSANEANMAIAAILRTIESRTARLEGIEENRQHGNGRR